MSESSTGHVKWEDWAFDYGVFGDEGLSLVDGYFRGQRMFNKLSMPVIRVKYVLDEVLFSSVFGLGCGPYNDKITWDTEDFGENLNPISGPHHLVKLECDGEDRYICIEDVPGPVPQKRLAVYARIGAYHIYQSWTLNNDGWLFPRVSSKGLSCNLDHKHHPHWRLDFSLGMPERQRVAAFPANGPKLADITTEGAVINSVFSRDVEYRITSTQPPDVGTTELPAEAIVRPPMLDDTKGIVGPDSYCSFDGYVRKYRPEEDVGYTHDPERELSFPVHEPCVDEDIVFWSIAHMSHHAHEGKEHWHTAGPDIFVRPMIVASVPPECLRVIDITGNIHVKDFGVFKDRWAHTTFTEQVLVNPNVPFQEVFKTLQQGDVTAELIIRVEWLKDSSVNVRVVANLLDELERVARLDGTYNVPRDSSWKGGLHLVDHHSGDPDTADMDYEVSNNQQ